MTHLFLPSVTAFFVAPHAYGRRESLPERGGGLPLAFIVFGLACVALAILETRLPALSAAVSTLDSLIVPEL